MCLILPHHPVFLPSIHANSAEQTLCYEHIWKGENITIATKSIFLLQIWKNSRDYISNIIITSWIFISYTAFSLHATLFVYNCTVLTLYWGQSMGLFFSSDSHHRESSSSPSPQSLCPSHAHCPYIHSDPWDTEEKTIYIYINRGYIMGGFVYDLYPWVRMWYLLPVSATNR